MSRFAFTLALLAAGSDALATDRGAFNLERRQVFGVLGGAAAVVAGAGQASAAASTVKTGQASLFTGDYDDPNHPDCLRQVKVVGAPMRADGSRPRYAIIEVTGYDGKEGEKICKARPTREELWKVLGKMNNNDEAILDFSSKGGPSNLVAKWDGDGIVFPDGNKWTKVSYGTNARRPTDMSTLKSE